MTAAPAAAAAIATPRRRRPQRLRLCLRVRSRRRRRGMAGRCLGRLRAPVAAASLAAGGDRLRCACHDATRKAVEHRSRRGPAECHLDQGSKQHATTSGQCPVRKSVPACTVDIARREGHGVPQRIQGLACAWTFGSSIQPESTRLAMSSSGGPSSIRRGSATRLPTDLG